MTKTTIRRRSQMPKNTYFRHMSQFVVSARKYRPLRFDEVVGQDHVTATLKNALNTDKVAHAFLFCGPRGVGKTSCARILAKAINCENPAADREPCNECSSCKAFNEQASFNIIELDAASNNKVEHIRLLNEQVRFQPQQGSYKVFIIDEVHMLTTQAFNAFLKTLEEPPPYAIFILATTEKHKILPTILSRCQIFDFHRIQVPAITQHLKNICEWEKIEAEEEALRLIASKADGALRDALSLFDRIATISADGITYKDVIQQLNILDYDYFFQFVNAFLEENIARVFELYDEVLANGFDGDIFILGLADHLRQLLVAQHPSTHALIDGGEALKTRYVQQAGQVSKSFLLTGLSLLNECDIHYPRAQHKRLHVEIALSRICYMQRARKGQAPSPDAPAAEKKKIVTPPDQTADSLKKSPSAEPPIETKSKSSEENIKTKKPDSDRVKRGIPTITDTDDLKDEIQAEMETKPTEAIELNPDSLQKEWDQYLQSLQSASVRKLFESSDISLNNSTISVRVATQIAKDTIAQDDSFVQHLRQTYMRSDLKMDIKIDEEKAAKIKKQSVKPLNAREKFAKMAESNPKLIDLQSEFNLIPDGEL